jgi:hypothetical protein
MAWCSFKEAQGKLYLYYVCVTVKCVLMLWTPSPAPDTATFVNEVKIKFEMQD